MKNHLSLSGLLSIALSMSASALTVNHDDTLSAATVYYLSSTDMAHQTESYMEKLLLEAGQDHPVEITANDFLTNISGSGFLLIGPPQPGYSMNYFREIAKGYPGSVPSNLCHLKAGDINKTITLTNMGCTISG